MILLVLIMLVMVMLLLFLLFFFVLLLLGLAVDFLEDVVDWLYGRLRFDSLLVWVVIDPTEPSPPLAHILYHNEVVAIRIWPLDPVLEARVLELQNVVDLNLIHPLLIVDHDLSNVGLKKKFFVDDEAAFLFWLQAWWMNRIICIISVA